MASTAQNILSPARPLEKDPELLEHIEIVKKVARAIARTVPGHISYHDLVSAGNLALAMTLKSGKLEGRTKEEAKRYVTKRVRGEILDELSRLDDLSKHTIRTRRKIDQIKSARPNISEAALLKELGMSFDNYQNFRNRAIVRGSNASMDDLSASNLPPDEGADHLIQVQKMQRLIEQKLSERDRRVLGLILQERPYREISEMFGISEPYISQILNGATRKLASAIGAESALEK